MKYFFYVMLGIAFSGPVHAKKLKVLFVGNSYTDVNNLPEVVKQVASSLNDTLVYQKSAPGGYTFEAHCSNTTTLGLIAQGGWDYVVLQEQSQFPSFPINEVENGVFPYARKLDSLIHIASPCAKTVFYMTWGRKNGDPDNCPQWPPVCTYRGMDSLLQLRYTTMAQMNEASISPVAKVWRFLRTNNPTIELYSGDGSHPSTAGTYAAALSFYAVLFGKDATPASYTFGIGTNDANAIKNAAKLVAFDSLVNWRQYDDNGLTAAYTYSNTNAVFNFVNTSTGNSINSYKWNFGDGTPEVTTQHASHTFATSGGHQVCLTVKNQCGEDMFCSTVTSGTVGIEELDDLHIMKLYPNPGHDYLQIQHVIGKCSYMIYNGIGAKIKWGSVDDKRTTIDIRGISNGIYYLELQNEKTKIQLLKFEKD